MVRTRQQEAKEAAGFFARHCNVYVYVPNLIGAGQLGSATQQCCRCRCPSCRKLLRPNADIDIGSQHALVPFCLAKITLAVFHHLQAMHVLLPRSTPLRLRCSTRRRRCWPMLPLSSAMNWMAASLASSTNAPPLARASCQGCVVVSGRCVASSAEAALRVPTGRCSWFFFFCASCLKRERVWPIDGRRGLLPPPPCCAVLDMVTDRLATTCLLVVLAVRWPACHLPALLLIWLDIFRCAQASDAEGEAASLTARGMHAPSCKAWPALAALPAAPVRRAHAAHARRARDSCRNNINPLRSQHPHPHSLQPLGSNVFNPGDGRHHAQGDQRTGQQAAVALLASSSRSGPTRCRARWPHCRLVCTRAHSPDSVGC